MRLYIPDMTEFFGWMDQSGYRYVVLRSFDHLDRGYPPAGSKEDIDLLVDDAALPAVAARYHRYRRRQGVKCDVYNASGRDHGGYLGHPYMPPPLAEKALAERRLWKGIFYVPSAAAHLLSLAFHVCYQKAERAKLALDDAALNGVSKYIPAFESLLRETGSAADITLAGLHRLLKHHGYAIDYKTLCAYVQNDYARDVKSLFLAHVMADMPGEMNMFVIRRIAVIKNAEAHLINALRSHYKILAVKDIPLFTRLTKSRRMRGGKWRRGGQPSIVVLVYDPHPSPTTAEDRKIHPHVLNSRQFMKRELREWFTKTCGTKASANPIHSTDNEAEAVGHLPLFFSPHEEEDIFHRLSELRGAAG